jgi:diacylglycerol kinase (ATP)
MSSPFGPLVLIANPRAGRGKVGRMLPEVERVLRAQGLEYRIVVTQRPGHATQAARDALLGGERFVVAAGGDGTVHEVVNGMFADDLPVVDDAVLGVAACGSGCDFVRTFDLPGDAVKAATHLSGSATRRVDVGRISLTAPDGTRAVRYFANIAEAGIDADTVARATRLPRWMGRAQYVVAFWIVLPRFQATIVRVDADGQALATRMHNVVVANARYFGGGMQISPKSSPEDGLLDVLAMTGPKIDAFTLVPKAYRGTHLPHRNIVELRARRVSVEGDRPLLIEADGEVVGTTPAIFEVLPGALLLKV